MRTGQGWWFLAGRNLPHQTSILSDSDSSEEMVMTMTVMMLTVMMISLHKWPFRCSFLTASLSFCLGLFSSSKNILCSLFSVSLLMTNALSFFLKKPLFHFLFYWTFAGYCWNSRQVIIFLYHLKILFHWLSLFLFKSQL